MIQTFVDSGVLIAAVNAPAQVRDPLAIRSKRTVLSG